MVNIVTYCTSDGFHIRISFSVKDINIDAEEENEEEIINKRRKQREELLKVSFSRLFFLDLVGYF